MILSKECYILLGRRILISEISANFVRSVRPIQIRGPNYGFLREASYLLNHWDKINAFYRLLFWKGEVIILYRTASSSLYIFYFSYQCIWLWTSPPGHHCEVLKLWSHKRTRTVVSLSLQKVGNHRIMKDILKTTLFYKSWHIMTTVLVHLWHRLHSDVLVAMPTARCIDMKNSMHLCLLWDNNWNAASTQFKVLLNSNE